MEFAADARQLLKWATWFALYAKAQEVDFHHLCQAAYSDSAPTPTHTWDIPFSAEMKAGLERACHKGDVITRQHILQAFGLEREPLPALPLTKALTQKTKDLLSHHGIDTAKLWPRLKALDVRDCLLPLTSASSDQASRLWHALASQASTDLAPLFLCMQPQSPALPILREAGISEEFLAELVKATPTITTPEIEISTDVRALPGADQLSEQSLLSLELAARGSQSRTLQPDDLLPALLFASSQASLLLQGLDALETLIAAIGTRVVITEVSDTPLTLAPELRRALDIAIKAAAPNRANTAHLLLGLAEIGHPLIAQLKHSIRAALQ